MASFKNANTMTHFASYWQFFDNQQEPKVVTGWRIRSKSRLADAAKGDVLWLFTSGEKCARKLDEDKLPDGGVENSQAYLTEVFTISSIIPEIAGPFLLVKGMSDKCIGMSDKGIRLRRPLLIDGIVRPDGWGKEKPIGSLRQGAWRLRPQIADLLQKKLKQNARTSTARFLANVC